MEIRTLNTFLLVTKLGSFSQTAKQLGYSQSTVTMQIQQLENELGIPLFDRIGKTVALTPAGEKLAGYARTILQISEQAKNDLQNTQVRGTLRMGLAESLCSIFFPQVLKVYHERYPQVEIVLIRGGHQEMLTKLNHNEIDMFYTLGEPLFQKELVKEMNVAEETYFICSSRHPFAGKENITLEDVLKEEFILTEKGMSYRDQLEQFLARRDLELTGYLELGDIIMIRQLVENDMGLSFLPGYAVNDSIGKGTMKKLEVPGCHIIAWRQLVRRKDKFVTPQMKTMIHLLTELEENAHKEKENE